MRFGLDGVTYDIDLTSANASELRSFLDRYIKLGRRVGGRKTGRLSADRLSRSQAKQIREWATAKGIDVGNRGRIPVTVVEQWRQAHAA